MTLYKDRRIECLDEELRISAYYFPFGTKRIRYGDIRSATSFPISPLKGKLRVWGTGNFRYWASFDPSRPGKSIGVTLDLGRHVHPYVTPDDAPAFIAVIEEKTGKAVEEGTAPFV